MSEEEVERLTYDLRSEFTDVGHYSYAGLCAYSLCKLYGDSKWDKEYCDKCLKSIVAHLGQKAQFAESMSAIATGLAGLEDARPFVMMLSEEKAVEAHGPDIVPQDFIMLTLKEGQYDSRMRTLSKYLSLLLMVDWERMQEFEDLVLDSFKEEEHELTEEEEKERDKSKKNQKIKRYALIGLATVGGGTLIGLTGGLAAPFLAAGAGAIIGASGAAALGSVAGVAIIGSLFGVAGAGLGAYKMKKRVGGIEEFQFEPLTEGRQLALTIAVSGWLTEDCSDFKTAWRGLDNSKEQYVLKYESKHLKKMGMAMDYLLSVAMSAAAQETLKYTILSGLLAAIAWPAAILSAASVIDNPWSVCTHRTVNVGKQLAEVLLSRQQGKRPVTLIGFSLGARVIFYCLQEMAKRKNCEGIVEDVIMLGTPCTGSPEEWEPFARVVAGKIVNGYCREDWLLKFLYRTASIQFTIAGLAPINWNNRRMHNIDLSDLVNGHMDYMTKIDEILSVVGIKTKERAKGNPEETLKQWVGIQKSRSASSKGSVSSSKTSSARNSIASSPSSSPLHKVKPTAGAKIDENVPHKVSEAATGIDNTSLDREEEVETSQPITQRESNLVSVQNQNDEMHIEEIATKLVEEVLDRVFEQTIKSCSLASGSCEHQNKNSDDQSNLCESHTQSSNQGSVLVLDPSKNKPNSSHEANSKESDTNVTNQENIVKEGKTAEEELSVSVVSNVTTPDSGIFLGPSAIQSPTEDMVS